MRRGLDALKFAVTAISRNLRRLPRGDRLTPLIQIVARIAQRQNFLACANGGRWTAAHLAAPERVAQRNSPTLLRQSSSAKGLDSFHSLPDISKTNMRKSGKTSGGNKGLIVPNDPASISYVRDIVARGEAAKADENGKLPPGKTHEIVGEVASGLPILKRIRIY
jgi:hypothetical protein